MSPEQARQFDEIHDYYDRRSREVWDQYERDLETARCTREAALAALAEAQRRAINDVVHGRPLTPSHHRVPTLRTRHQEQTSDDGQHP